MAWAWNEETEEMNTMEKGEKFIVKLVKGKRREQQFFLNAHNYGICPHREKILSSLYISLT